MVFMRVLDKKIVGRIKIHSNNAHEAAISITHQSFMIGRNILKSINTL